MGTDQGRRLRNSHMQVGFSTMSTIALAPLMCYTHPNGQQSILKYPNVICGELEHTVMLIAGVLLLVFGVFGFLSLCTYAALRVPHWSAKEQHARVRVFRFLVFRFRLDSWWFGVPLLTRGPLISLPIVLATDYPPIQTIWVTLILASFLVIQSMAWPWKARTQDRVEAPSLPKPRPADGNGFKNGFP